MVQFDDPLGDRQAEPRSALGLRVEDVSACGNSSKIFT